MIGRLARSNRWISLLYSQTAEAARPDQSYIVGLDGLRAFAVMLVFLGHYRFVSVGPMFGVQVFFVISGFIITRVLHAEYARSRSINIKDFYIRRFLRLNPALYVMIAIVVGCWSIIGHPFEFGAVLASVFYFSNYYQFYTGSTLYGMPLWSLAIEEHYYLVFPLLYLFFKNRSRDANVAPFLVGCLAVLLWRFYLFQQGEGDANYYRTDTRVDGLLYGVVLAQAWFAFPDFFSKPRIGILCGVGGALLLIFCFLLRDDFFRSVVMYSLQGIGIALVLAYVLFCEDVTSSLIRKTLEGSIAVIIGKLSYSIYLWHLPILMMLETQYGTGSLAASLAGSVITLVLACLSYWLIERPALSLRQYFGSANSTWELAKAFRGVPSRP